jgi:glyoxylase-like metal-dependent hydrolase (beta-lactamase superfamily II)
MTYCSPTFRIGGIEATALWDGPLETSLAKIPDQRHRARAERLVEQAAADALIMNVYAFLLCFDGRTALIDAGAGRLSKPVLGQLPKALAEAGVSADAVDAVFITHVAADHIGGLATHDQRPAFPNARLVIHDEEASFWIDQEPSGSERLRTRRATTREYFSLYPGRVDRVKDGQEIYGAKTFFAPGHTPGHTCWLFRSEGQALLAWGDLIHIAYIHLPAPDIVLEYDMDPKMALQTRLRVLDWVTRDSLVVVGTHLPTPGIGFVDRVEPGFAFRPLSV